MKHPKILLACPTSIHKYYCQDEWFEWIGQFTYPNLDILIIENSATEDNAIEINEKYPFAKVVYLKLEHKNIRERLTICSQYIYDYILENEYDFWMSIESDIFAPLNTIEYLLLHQKPFIGVPYFHFSGNETRLLEMETRMVHDIPFADYRHILASFQDFDGKLKQTYQNGLGCTLIHKNLLKHFKFRYEDSHIKGFPDYYMHLDLQRKKIFPYIDTSIACIHKNSNEKWENIKKTDNL